jgi:hypothetical protein
LPRPTSLTFITSIPPLFPCGPPYYLSKLPWTFPASFTHNPSSSYLGSV